MENVLPTYLIDLLAYTGYVNQQAISLINDEDIKIEEFASNTLPLLWTEEEKTFFWNIHKIFIRNILLFSIVDGYKKLLEFFRRKCNQSQEK